VEGWVQRKEVDSTEEVDWFLITIEELPVWEQRESCDQSIVSARWTKKGNATESRRDRTREYK
jgi:hypothetical protein